MALELIGSTHSGRIFVDTGGIYAQFGNKTAVKLA